MRDVLAIGIYPLRVAPVKVSPIASTVSEGMNGPQTSCSIATLFAASVDVGGERQTGEVQVLSGVACTQRVTFIG